MGLAVNQKTSAKPVKFGNGAGEALLETPLKCEPLLESYLKPLTSKMVEQRLKHLGTPRYATKVFLLLEQYPCEGECGTDGVGPEDLGASVVLLDRMVPTIGSGGVGYQVGGAYPGATRPLGMVALSPAAAA